ncbi:MAG TPA: hypothetical protein PLX94_03710 [Bacteroidia bacterium]|nr:hypothetical protein [Bacteroidia bacterium]HNG83659.1 hypothetical protein [Bacteroidia bacterium]
MAAKQVLPLHNKKTLLLQQFPFRSTRTTVKHSMQRSISMNE